MGEFFALIWTHIAQFFSMFKLNDVIDILIIAVAFYYIGAYMIESKAWQALRVILIIVILTPISSFLHLNTVSFLLESVLQIGAIALLIVFQPELRSFLDRLGRGTGLRRMLSPGIIIEKDTIDAIVSAVKNMSDDSTGALIVFEKQKKLDSIINVKGTTLNAEISRGLLENIFVKNTPLHDGAVIIKNEKIAYAQSILPLSENIAISTELGTRHRAAIGVTEKSDAIAVVVSEETGKISYAKDGGIHRDITPENLREVLTIEFSDITPVEADLRGLFKRGGKDE